MEGYMGLGSEHIPGCTCRICRGRLLGLGSEHIPG